jgi:hypothetical protein
MSGKFSRAKGARGERAIAHLLQARGFAATKISRAYQAGHDLELQLGGGRMMRIEVKCRATGFKQLYDWLDGRDILVVKSDRREPLVVLRMSLAADIAKAAGGTNVGVR